MARSKKLLKEYCEQVRGLAIQSRIVRDGREVKFILDPSKSPVQAVIRAKEPLLTLKDGSTLEFYEVIDLDSLTNQINRKKYSYQYQSHDGRLFFRYDRDTEAAYDKDGNPLYSHPENHLHANTELPRFMTHTTSFEEVLKFIEACFYTE